MPLAAIYQLGERRHDARAPFVETLDRAEGLMSLIANTYATKLMDKQMRAREFELLTRVVSHVPVRRVTPHADPARIHELCDSILSRQICADNADQSGFNPRKSAANISMYSLHFYGQMIADAQRMDAYAAALRATVKPDSVVMDLGCGPGVFAVLACKLGARRVYAVEPENVIGLAREIAAANGCADRIEFFEKLSTEITLPEPASIIVSDLRGVLPWFEQHIPSIIDARTRLLARGGVLIPRRDILWAALVEAPVQYAELVGPWQENKFGSISPRQTFDHQQLAQDTNRSRTVFG